MKSMTRDFAPMPSICHCHYSLRGTRPAQNDGMIAKNGENVAWSFCRDVQEFFSSSSLFFLSKCIRFHYLFTPRILEKVLGPYPVLEFSKKLDIISVDTRDLMIITSLPTLQENIRRDPAARI